MRIKQSTFFALCAFFIGTLHAETISPFSKYGNIQSVHNYSSNPYWTPDSPYNLRFPTAVYATGPDIETAQCQQIVRTLVYTECASLNNCATTELSDIRPTIILQLSRIPNGNYAASCAGYIDTAFEEYIKNYAIAVPTTGQVAFPDATPSNTTKTEQQIKNPFAPKTTDWGQEMQDRKSELQDLQAANGTGDITLARSAFPISSSDLSRDERLENAKTGYAPFKDAKAYNTLKIESAEAAATRAQQRQQRQNSYCVQQRSRYQTMVSDLNALKKCRNNGIKFADCKLQGRYK